MTVPATPHPSAMLQVAGAAGGQGTTTVATLAATLAALHRAVTLEAVRPADVCALAASTSIPVDGAVPLEIAPGLTLRRAADGAGDPPDSAGPDRYPARPARAAHRAVATGEPAASALTVIDCGRADEAPDTDGGTARPIRWLVLRGPCYLALRAALQCPWQADGVVLLCETGRALRAADVADVLGIPVLAEVAMDPRVARASDAGVLFQQADRLATLRPLAALVRRCWPVDLAASA